MLLMKTGLQGHPATAAPGRFHRRGQALVFTLVFAAAAGLVGLLLFNSGMLANTKTRLQNAADAGAYSAGVLQARDHNFSAYANRAMVANQVAVAQFVSLKSYLQDAAQTHERMSGVVLTAESELPSSKPLWDAAQKMPIEQIESKFAALAPKVVEGLDLLIGAFQNAQDIHHVATGIEMVVVADEVVKRNDPLAKVARAVMLGTTVKQIADWKGSTTAHSANDTTREADRFADVVVNPNSTDGFIRNRASVPLPSWASTVSWCRLAPNHFFSFTAFGFVHTGATQLSKDKKRWLGLDATMGGGIMTCIFVVPCPPAGTPGPCLVVTVPLTDGFSNAGIIPGGNGGAVAGKTGAYDSLNGYKNNPGATALYGGAAISPPGAYRYNIAGPGPTLDAGGGLQNYYRDMTNPLADIPKNQTAEENGGAFPITLEVERSAASIRTSSKILADSSALRMDDGLKGNTMRTLSSAHGYFYRPKTDTLADFTSAGWSRSDQKAEVANLFNPYWQTRLTDRTLPQRAISWAAQ